MHCFRVDCMLLFSCILFLQGSTNSLADDKSKDDLDLKRQLVDQGKRIKLLQDIVLKMATTLLPSAHTINRREVDEVDKSDAESALKSLPVDALKSLRGAPGRDGRDGRDGIGTPGRDGFSGRDGAAGPPGVQGPRGEHGRHGKDGAPGDPCASAGSSAYAKKLASATHFKFGNEVYYMGTSADDAAGNQKVSGIDSAAECYKICLVTNSGRCVSFSYKSSPSSCVVPHDDGTVTFRGLRKTSAPGYTTYTILVVPVDVSIKLHESMYTFAPKQLWYLGSGVGDVKKNFRTIIAKSSEECYQICLLANTACWVFSYSQSSSECSIPFDDGTRSTFTGLKISNIAAYNTYVMFDPNSRTDTFNSDGWSSLANLRIKDGQSEHLLNIVFSNVRDVTACYRVCLQTLATCQTFSYNALTKYCYLADANFHDDWTFTVAITDCTAYFLKNEGKWKLLTKHIEKKDVLPHNAYNNAGNWQATAHARDMSFTSSYQSHTSLKSSIVDSWRSLTSRYRVRLEMYSGSGTFLKYMEYEAVDTDSKNWFSSGKFISSSYSDLHRGVTHNSWAIQPSYRTFYVSRNHGGCTNDVGWLTIQSSVNCGCPQWDRIGSHPPMFLYASGSTSVNWSQSKQRFGVLIIKMSFK